MSLYRVICFHLELPFGSLFTWIPKHPLEAGELILLSLDRQKTIGRWYPAVDGFDWIWQPGTPPIKIEGQKKVHLYGPVVPMKRLPCWN